MTQRKRVEGTHGVDPVSKVVTPAISIPPPLVGGGQGAGFARGSALESRPLEDTSPTPWIVSTNA